MKKPLNKVFFKILKIFCIISTILSVLALASVVIYVSVRGIDKLSFELLFGEYDETPSIFPAFIGTFALVIISSIIAIPLGIFTAIFLTLYTMSSNKLVKIIRVANETLASIPSIVYGLFGYLVFVVALKWGYSLIGGGITLAIMILPVIVRQTEESILSVDKTYIEASYALGAGKIRTIFKVILPSASSGIITSIILALGRVISESAVLILTISMVVNKIPTSIFSPGTTLALDIYYFASYGFDKEAAATSFVLLILVLMLNLLASTINKNIRKKMGENISE